MKFLLITVFVLSICVSKNFAAPSTEDVNTEVVAVSSDDNVLDIDALKSEDVAIAANEENDDDNSKIRAKKSPTSVCVEMHNDKTGKPYTMCTGPDAEVSASSGYASYAKPNYGGYSAPAPTYSKPSYGYSAPSYSAPSYSAPSYSAPSYSAPSHGYAAPSHAYAAPSYAAPSHYSAPSKPSYGGYSAPSKPSYGGYAAPSHGYSAPSHGYSAPSHAYSAPSYSAPSHGYAAPSYAAPAPSYSAPAYAAPAYAAPAYAAPAYSAPSYSAPAPSYGGYRAIDMEEETEVGAPAYGGYSAPSPPPSYGYSAPTYAAHKSGYSAPAYKPAPVYAGPAKAYTYGSPAPQVPCPTNLLFSCQPSVAPVPCAAYAPSYSAPSYSAPSYSAPAYSAPAPAHAPAYSAPAPSYSSPAPSYAAPTSSYRYSENLVGAPQLQPQHTMKPQSGASQRDNASPQKPDQEENKIDTMRAMTNMGKDDSQGNDGNQKDAAYYAKPGW